MTVPIGDDDNDGEDNRPSQSAHDLPLEQREHQRRIVRVRRCVHAQGDDLRGERDRVEAPEELVEEVGMGRFHAVALDEGEEVQKFGGRHIGCRRRRCRRAILVVGFVLGGEDDDSPLGFRWRLARKRLGGNAMVVVRLLLLLLLLRIKSSHTLRIISIINRNCHSRLGARASVV